MPWTEAENRISAVGASIEAAADLLALDAGAALLAVERRTWRAGEPVTWVRQLFPGEAYDLVARFGPARGAYSDCPSSTVMTDPVTARAASLLRYSAIASRSEVSISRLRGKLPTSFAPPSLSNQSSFSSVLM